MKRTRIWKNAPSFPNYEVSNDGKVRKIGKSRPLHQVNANYKLVSFDNGTIGVHRLVAHTFLTEKSKRETKNKDCVNHINGKTWDNRVENLEWCSRSENSKHAWRTGLCKPKERIYSKGKRAPLLTIKRLRELAEDYAVQHSKDLKAGESVRIFQFISFVDFMRPSLRRPISQLANAKRKNV